jgi:hypothetical protein
MQCNDRLECYSSASSGSSSGNAIVTASFSRALGAFLKVARSTLWLYRGIFPDESSRKTKRLSFPTLEKLNQAIEKEREDALGRGFKLYTLPWAVTDGKPFPNSKNKPS